MQWSQLEDADWYVRQNALKALGKLELETLAQHADAVVARLEDSHIPQQRAQGGIGDPG